jgi:hypothetical protein
MKAKIIPILTLIIFSVPFFYSCEDATYKEYTGNVPVYMSFEDLRSGVTTDQNAEIKKPGKIYFKDNFIFIVEEMKGIHVFDNSNPAAPVQKTFLKVPGAVDIAISGNIMYTDSYVDLVAVDVQDVNNIHEVARLKDIFPYLVPPTDNKYPMGYVDEEKGVVTGWEVKQIKEKIHVNNNPYPFYGAKEDFMLFNSAMPASSSGISGSGVGVGGSMARFGLKDKVLYILDENTLRIFDITNKTSPAKIADLSPGWGIETMFISGNTMYMGTTTGMLIYDISIPLAPVSKGRFNHARACDPVVVDDTLAYVTLRTGTTCGGIRNVLDVVNVKNITNPSLVSSFPLVNPHGLGKDGNLLFICDGSAGLKIFDSSNPWTITSHLLYSYPNINAVDVIPLGNVLILIGDDGLFQYNYSNISNITLLSKIEVAPKVMVN